MKGKSVFRRLLLVCLSVMMVVTLMPSMAGTAYASTNNEYSGITIYGETDYSIVSGVTETKISMRNVNKENVKGYMLTISPTARVDLKASYKGYYGKGTTKQSRAAAAESWSRWGMQKMTDQAKAYEASGDVEGRVVFATNGDYFDMTNGAPLGSLIMEGNRDLNPNNDEPYFAVLKDGSYVIRTGDVPKDDVMECVSGYHLLLKDGENLWGQDHADPMPRNSVGIKADGTIVFLEVDGRQEKSVGMTLFEIAETLKDMGCVDALYIDGGGSATFATRREGEDALTVKNSPSDGIERSVSDGWLLVSAEEGDNNFDHAKLSPKNEFYTPGSEVQFTAKGIDGAGSAVDLPEGCTWQLADDSKDLGTIDASTGLFKANEEYAGEAKVVNVQMVYGGKVVGSTKITVAAPDEIRFTNDTITLDYNETSTLGMSVFYDGREVTYKDGDFNWTMETIQSSDPDATIGHMEGNTFVGTDDNAAGNLSIQARVTATSKWNEEVTNSIVVGIGMKPVIVMDGGDGTEVRPLNYNNIAYTHADANGGGIAFETHADDHGDVVVCHYINGDGTSRGGLGSAEVVDRDTGMVRKGQYALKLNYDFTNINGIEGCCVGFCDDIPIDGSPSAVGIWVYAPEGTPNLWLRLRCRNGGGTISTLNFTQQANQATDGTKGGINWTGWKYLECPLKEVQTPITLIAGETFRVMDTNGGQGDMGTWVCTKDDTGNVSEPVYVGHQKGFLYLDNMQFVYGSAAEDTDNPKVNSFKAGSDMSHLVELDPEGKTVVNSNKVSFSGEFADVHNKLSSGINYAYIYIDGVNMTKKFSDDPEHYAENIADGRASLTNMTLANGTHTVTLLAVDNNDNEASVTRTFTVDGNDESLTSVDVKGSSDVADLGEEFTLDITSNKLEDVQKVDTTVKISEGTPVKNVEFADGYTGTFNVNGDTVSISAEKTGEQAGEGKIATVLVDVPHTLPENSYLTYKVESGTVTYVSEKDASVANTFAASTVSVPVKAFYNVTVGTMIVGNKSGVITVTDMDGNPAEGVYIYDQNDNRLGSTGEDGKCSVSDFVDEVKEFSVYAHDKNGYSFIKKAQSLKAAGDGDGKPYHIIYNATKDASTEKNITWLSNPNAAKKKSLAQYALKADYDAKGEEAFTDFEGKLKVREFTASGDINNNYAVYVNQALLTGLEPSTEYCYRVGDGNNWSEVKTFKTFAKFNPDGGNSTKFFIIGDAQTAGENVENLKNIVEDTKEGYDFGMQMGDAVEVPKLYSDWENFLDAFGQYPMDVFHVIGNHESFGDPEAENANAIFGTPDDNYYSVVYGNVYVATVSFTGDRAKLKEAADWVAEDAAKAEADWKILVMHQPPYYTNATSGDNEIINELFPPAVDKGGIDFVFSGHDHSYARTYPITDRKLAEDYKMADKGEAENIEYTGDGAIYYICGSTGEKSYAVETTQDFFPLFSKATQDFESLYLTVEADEDHMTVTTMDGNMEFDKFTKVAQGKNCKHSYDTYDAETGKLHCEKCGRRFSAEELKYTGLIQDKETGKNRFLIDGVSQTGIQTVEEDAIVFGNDGLAYDGTIKVADTEYTLKDGLVESSTDENAGNVFLGYCGADEDGENLIYAYQPGNNVLNIGLNPFKENPSGDMKDWEGYRDCPWQAHRLEIEVYNVGEGVTSIGSRAAYIPRNPSAEGLKDLDSALREVNLPSTLKKIGDQTFYNNVNLLNVTLPAALEEIGNGAFRYIEGIKVTMEGENAPKVNTSAAPFTKCGKAAELTVKCSTSWHDAIANGEFPFPGTVVYTDHDPENTKTDTKMPSAEGKGVKSTYCGVCGETLTAEEFTLNKGETFKKSSITYKVTTKDQTVSLTKFGKSAATKATVAKTVTYGGVTYKITSIGTKAFSGKTKLKTVTMGANVKTIGEKAFYKCTALTALKGMGNVKTIKKSAFNGCTKLARINSLKKCKTIGNYAFSKCAALKQIGGTKNTVILPAVTTIGTNAFAGCKAMTSVKISSTALTKIGKNAFRGDSKLAKVRISSKSLKKSGFGTNMFYGVNKNIKVYVPKAKLKAYKTYLKNKGLKNTAKILAF